MSKAQRVQPIAPVLVGNLVSLAEAYAKATGVKMTTVGTHSTRTSTFYLDLASGETSCTLRKYDLLTEWFEANWPKGHAMPSLTDPKHYPTRERKDHGKKVHRDQPQTKSRKEGGGIKGAGKENRAKGGKKEGDQSRGGGGKARQRRA